MDEIKRKIEVAYCCKSDIDSHAYVSGLDRFDGWFDFADWLKQETLKGPVLITSWRYV